MSKGTIVFVTGSRNLSGADFSMCALINKLKKEDYEIIVLINGKGKTTEFYEKNNINYIIVPFKSWLWKYDNLFIKIFVKCYKSIKNTLLALNCKRSFKKIKVNDIKCVYCNGFTNSFAVKLANRLDVKCVYHMREFGDRDFGWKFINGKCKQYDIIESKVNCFIAISNAVKESFSKSKNYKRINVVYNGVSVNNKISTEKDFDKTTVNVVITGRLSKGKGHILLLSALREIIEKGYKNVKLDIYGEGSEKDNISNYIQENKLNQYVELKGFVYNIDYSLYDIGIMASSSEGFGRVTVEYMLSGLATIATNTGANPEIISNNIDGVLFENNNYHDLANKLINLIEDNDKRKKISLNAQINAQKKFNEETYVNNVFNLLKKENIL